MRKYFTSLKSFMVAVVMLLSAAVAMAQVPQAFNYQATVRDNNGNLVANKNVSVRISILQGTAEGSAVYSETHAVTTSDNGFFNLYIGKGTAVTGTFANIQWGNGPLFLRSEIDPNGGSDYAVGSTQQLVSVPYALYAASTDLTVVNQRIDSLGNVVENNNASPVPTRTVSITEGALPSTFTVNENGGRIKFSQGNLQYQASTSTWRFADNQYDYVGENNRGVSENYAGWIDLFGWGTSGYHDPADAANLNYQPYSTSATATGDINNYYAYGPSTNMSSTSLTEESAGYDWGVHNSISNGGGQAGLWRALTGEEWSYLFDKRTCDFQYNGASYNVRYCMANVAGRQGVILFPDSYVLPEGLQFPYTNNCGGEYSSYIVDEAQWYAMEAAGAVFLPASGRRNGAEVNHSGSDGYYWSASNLYSLYAYGVIFRTGYVRSQSGSGRGNGFAVRLVKAL